MGGLQKLGPIKNKTQVSLRIIAIKNDNPRINIFQIKLLFKDSGPPIRQVLQVNQLLPKKEKRKITTYT